MVKSLYLAFMLAITALASSAQFAQPAYACNDSLLGLPAWYRGLQDASCNITLPAHPDVTKLIMTIGLNVVQAGLVLVAYVAVFFIIKGGFGYITSAGSSDGMASAKKTITNALIGLVIAVFSASIVNAIAGIIK